MTVPFRSPTCRCLGVQLVSILREVKYLRQLERDDIPAEAAAMDDGADMYRQFVSNLELICTS